MKICDLFENDGDDSELPQAQIDALVHELQELAKSDEQEFPSALALVHDAYKICNVERPAPSMRGAWAQYEKCITLAVQYLGKFKPDGNWRATTATSK